MRWSWAMAVRVCPGPWPDTPGKPFRISCPPATGRTPVRLGQETQIMPQDVQFPDNIPLLGDALSLTAALVRLAAVLLARRPSRRHGDAHRDGTAPT
jgi:hypothetical protein